jgi:hypothetical protein
MNVFMCPMRLLTQEYHNFFSKFGEVVTLTIALKNGGLMKVICSEHLKTMRYIIVLYCIRRLQIERCYL